MYGRGRQLMAMVVLLGSSGWYQSAQATEFPPHIRVGEHRLALNGWGARSKAFFQLYVAGLYVTQPSSDAVAIVAADEPMAIRIKITSSFISQAKLVSSLTEGFERATEGNVAPIQGQIDQFRACFSDAITKGDTFDMVYVPQHGVIVNKNGELKGVVEGAEFKRALFNIWLSDNPADEGLKQAMLTGRTVR